MLSIFLICNEKKRNIDIYINKYISLVIKKTYKISIEMDETDTKRKDNI